MKNKNYLRLLYFVSILFCFNQLTKAQCTANFSYFLGLNGQVSFSSTSVGTTSVTNYKWDYNTLNYGTSTFSATGSAGINPSFTYSANGMYFVSLTIWSSVPSCSSNIQYTLNITNATNTCVLNALFTTQIWNQTNGLVTFGNNSSGISSGATYTWNYGDGITAIGLNPSHQYTTNGTYVVSLTANNNYTSLCTSTYSANVLVNTICGFTASPTPWNGPAGVVTFSSLAGGINAQTNFNWNFGDNTSLSGQGLALSIVTHTYYSSGQYPVTLWLSSVSPSCNTQFTTTVNVTNAITPPCNLVAAFNFTQGANGSVTFNSTSTGTIAQSTYSWNFGTGMSWGNFNANLISPTYVYNNNQAYVVTLTVSNNVAPACVSTQTALVTVNTTTCNLVPGLSYSVVSSGLVSFTNTTTGGNASPSYFWDFGDSSPSSTINPMSISHTYSVGGTYNVYSVLLSTAPSCTATALQVISVTTGTGSPCNLVPSFSSVQGANGLVSFISTSAGTTASSTYSWNFGNGQTTSGNSASCTFTANGSYVVYLLINNNSAPPCSNAITQTISVTSVNVPCNLVSAFSYSLGGSGNVNFTDASTGTNSNTVYYWNFGDGSFSSNQFPVHVYPSAGNYTVSFTVSDGTNSLCVNSSTQNVNVSGIPCNANANFTISPTNTPLFWSATPAFPWNVTSAMWTWGDGSSSNQLYTSHTYSAAGIYNICLTVTVSCNATSSACASYSISKMYNLQNLNMIQIDVIEPAMVEVGIKAYNQEISGITLFPNPSNGNFIIESDSYLKGKVEISIYNLLGDCIYKLVTEETNGYLKEEIKISDVAKGVYILKLTNSNTTYTQKIMFDN